MWWLWTQKRNDFSLLALQRHPISKLLNLEALHVEPPIHRENCRPSAASHAGAVSHCLLCCHPGGRSDVSAWRRSFLVSRQRMAAGSRRGNGAAGGTDRID